VEHAIRAARQKGKGIKKIATELGVGVNTVQRGDSRTSALNSAAGSMGRTSPGGNARQSVHFFSFNALS
jgi:hypothetical protein